MIESQQHALRPAVLRRVALRAASLSAYLGYWLVEEGWRPRKLDGQRRRELNQRHMRRISRELLNLVGARYEVVGPGGPADKARLVVANHRTVLDIAILLEHFGGTLLSRSDIREWPILGRIFEQSDLIFVDRQNHQSSVMAMLGIRRRLHAGDTVIVFPEGAIFEGDEVRAFHPGAFAAARELNVEVVPVGLAYPPGAEWLDTSFAAHLANLAFRSTFPVVACVGASLRPEGGSNEMAARAQAAVQSLVERSRERLSSS